MERGLDGFFGLERIFFAVFAKHRYWIYKSKIREIRV
jgi:hypothetical protein